MKLKSCGRKALATELIFSCPDSTKWHSVLIAQFEHAGKMLKINQSHLSISHHQNPHQILFERFTRGLMKTDDNGTAKGAKIDIPSLNVASREAHMLKTLHVNDYTSPLTPKTPVCKIGEPT